MEIVSRTNPRIQHLKRLHKGNARRKCGQFIIEGAREVVRAAQAGVKIEELYLCPDLFKAEARLSAGALAAIETRRITVSRPVFEAVSLREGPDGVIALAYDSPRPLQALSLGDRPLILLAEAFEKPGNIGALLRSADAAGVTAVILTDPVADLMNPNVIRASQGTVFALPIATATTTETLTWLQQRSIPLIALTPDAPSLIWNTPLDGPCCLAFGSEANGLTATTLAAANITAKLPMAGSADSLNVATCAAIALFEAVRQRSQQLVGLATKSC